MYKYRIENIFIPAAGGIASPGAESQDIPRRIIHVLSEVPKAGREGAIFKVLTEEETAAPESFPLRTCPTHGTQMAISTMPVCAVPDCEYHPSAISEGTHPYVADSTLAKRWEEWKTANM